MLPIRMSACLYPIPAISNPLVGFMLDAFTPIYERWSESAIYRADIQASSMETSIFP